MKEQIEGDAEGEEIDWVGCVVWESNVEIADLLNKGIVPGSVDGKREHRRGVAKDQRRAIALMHIEVDDGDRPQMSFCDEGFRGNGHVVEDAIAGAVTGEGMMCSAGEAGGYSFAEGDACRGDGGAHCAERTFHKLRRPRETEPTESGFSQPALKHVFHVSRIVDTDQIRDPSRWRFDQIPVIDDVLIEDGLAEEGVFLDRECVAWGKRNDEPVA